MTLHLFGRRVARGRHPPGEGWLETFERLSRDELSWEVAGHAEADDGVYTWQYSVRRRVGGVVYGATKLAHRLDVAELIEVERAARRAMRTRRWIILPGSADWPVACTAAAVRRVRFEWPRAP